MSKTADEILVELFCPELGANPNSRLSEPNQGILSFCPQNEDIRELAELLKNEPKEKELQQFLVKYPKFILGICGTNYDKPLAFFVESSIKNIAPEIDFAVLTYGQGGCFIYLVEIKRSVADLYVKSGRHAESLREAIKQVEDRNMALKEGGSNMQAFVSTTLKNAKDLPQYPEKSKDGSFRLYSSDKIEKEWQTFGGYGCAMIEHIIIIGRWANLQENERKRLILHNRDNSDLYKIFTYDQLARSGFDRPYTFVP